MVQGACYCSGSLEIFAATRRASSPEGALLVFLIFLAACRNRNHVEAATSSKLTIGTGDTVLRCIGQSTNRKSNKSCRESQFGSSNNVTGRGN
jgi:hypothetical protein